MVDRYKAIRTSNTDSFNRYLNNATKEGYVVISSGHREGTWWAVMELSESLVGARPLR